MIIFTTSEPLSTHYAESQVEALLNLRKEIPLCTLFAIENAAALIEREEPFERGLLRAESLMERLGKPLYISLTWNEANRFGGGNESSQGLTGEGADLLTWMAEKGIAVDFSHTSDALAQDILKCIDVRGLKINVLASHSNFRAVQNCPRNLPDWLAREIIARKGVIGLNFFAPFVGTGPDALLRHVDYALSLGAIDTLAFGADFFYEEDFSHLKEKYQIEKGFFDRKPSLSIDHGEMSFYY